MTLRELRIAALEHAWFMARIEFAKTSGNPRELLQEIVIELEAEVARLEDAPSTNLV